MDYRSIPPKEPHPTDSYRKGDLLAVDVAWLDDVNVHDSIGTPASRKDLRSQLCIPVEELPTPLDQPPPLIDGEEPF